jgi:hypothetical protein
VGVGCRFLAVSGFRQHQSLLLRPFSGRSDCAHEIEPWLLTNVGAAISAPDRHQKPLTMQHWNFNIQRQFPANIALELTYAGSRGTHLWQNLQLNQLPDNALSLGTELQRVGPNPFGD